MDTLPLRTAPLSIWVMPCSQNAREVFMSCTASRRFIVTEPSATWLSKTLAPWSTAWTTAGIPFNNPSA